MRFRKRPFAIERLERRDLFAAYAVPWPEVDSLQLSFVPDGTQVGDSRSELFSILNSAMPDVDWQLQMLTAFQTWAIETDANVGLVEDQGQPIGTIGFKQGDLRFGDVRLGAFAMAKDVLAVANPYDPFIANTWVGDVFLNNDTSFLKDAQNQAKSLLSVMLHEAGHVFGMGHSTDTASPMYPFFQNLATTLTPQDIANLRTIYTARQPDRWEGSNRNDSLTTATEIDLTDSLAQLLSQELTADISSHDDIDTYALKIPESANSLHVELHASGKSLLKSQLTLINQQGEVITSTTAHDPRANDLELLLDSVQPGDTYYVQVRSADSSVFGIGRYELEVTPFANIDAPEPQKSVMELRDLPVFAPEEWIATTPGYVEHTYYELAGMLDSQRSSQRFRFHSPTLGNSLTNVFTVILSAETGDISNLDVTVTDPDGNPIPMTLLSNANGKLELQASGVKADADYLATVFSLESPQPQQAYELEIDFALDGRLLQTVVNDTLDDAQPIHVQPLAVSESGHYHFVVSGSDWSDPHESGVTMRIRDAAGHVIATTEVVDGSSQSTDLVLNKGHYTAEFTSPNRLVGSSVLFQLAMEVETSPIGPQLRDMSSKPVEQAAAPPIDALFAHWLPGTRASEFPALVGAQAALKAAWPSEQKTPSAVLSPQDPTVDIDSISEPTPKLERLKPKKSEQKPAPLVRPQTSQMSAIKHNEASEYKVSRAASPQTHLPEGDVNKPQAEPEKSTYNSIGFGELDEIAIDAAIQFASFKASGLSPDNAPSTIATPDSPIDHEESRPERSESNWLAPPIVASMLAAGMVFASFIRSSVASSTQAWPRSAPARNRIGKASWSNQ